MDIKWYGHSCFLITADAGTRILTDPYDPSVGYPMHKIACDAVTASHAHFDHAYFDMCAGEPVRITEPGKYEVGEIAILGVSTYHDADGGVRRGKNIVFVYEIEGMRVVHAGDLGEIPNEETLARIGPADVLLVPVGGYYTIDHNGARELANKLRPKVVIPMHYKTNAVDERFQISDLTPFLSSLSGCAIHRLRQSDCVLTKESLGADRVITLEYAKE